MALGRLEIGLEGTSCISGGIILNGRELEEGIVLLGGLVAV